MYNWLSYGIVGNSVCRTWESCTLAFPCAVNRVIHDSIACYAHFHNACLLVFGSFVRNSVVLAVYLLFSVACFFTVHEHSVRASIVAFQRPIITVRLHFSTGCIQTCNAKGCRSYLWEAVSTLPPPVSAAV